MTEMLDMSRFVEAKSDQLNADDLIGNPRTVTITRVTGADGDQPVAIFYQGDSGKPFKPCKTMRRVLMATWGKYANEYVGRSMTLYRDDSVTFGGLATGGIRISHMSHLEKETVVVVMKTKGKKAGIKVLPLQVQEPAVQEDKAAQWAANFCRELARTDDAAALEAKHSKTLAKLKTDRPDLWKDVEHVLNSAKVDNPDDPFAEGPANEQRGESNAFDADQIIEFINAKVRVEDVNALVASHTDSIMSFSDEDRDRVAVAQADRLEAIKGAAQ